MKLEAPVWRHEFGLVGPTFIGTLSHVIDNQQWQFNFDSAYLKSETAQELDPHWCLSVGDPAAKPDLKSAFILEATHLTPIILRTLTNDSSSGAFGDNPLRIQCAESAIFKH